MNLHYQCLISFLLVLQPVVASKLVASNQLNNNKTHQIGYPALVDTGIWSRSSVCFCLHPFFPNCTASPRLGIRVKFTRQCVSPVNHQLFLTCVLFFIKLAPLQNLTFPFGKSYITHLSIMYPLWIALFLYFQAQPSSMLLKCWVSLQKILKELLTVLCISCVLSFLSGFTEITHVTDTFFCI